MHTLPANQTESGVVLAVLVIKQMATNIFLRQKNKIKEGLTATDVTDDLLNKRSASLNFLFLLSVLLLEFLLN